LEVAMRATLGDFLENAANFSPNPGYLRYQIIWEKAGGVWVVKLWYHLLRRYLGGFRERDNHQVRHPRGSCDRYLDQRPSIHASYSCHLRLQRVWAINKDSTIPPPTLPVSDKGSSKR